MPYLIIKPVPDVTLAIRESLSPHGVEWDGHFYRPVAAPDDSLLFYDWIRDSDRNVVGLEVQSHKDHADWLGDLCRLLIGKDSGFLQITFLPGTSGTPDAIQGFGDIFFFRCALGDWLIAVGTDLWLKPPDVIWLQQLVREREAPRSVPDK